MFVYLGNLLNIDNLDREIKIHQGQSDPISKRKTAKICVIDDNMFPKTETLIGNGYDVTFLGDIRSITRADTYSIVLCDLQDVGTYLNEDEQGAHLIREIKKQYPFKEVIAYTGAMRSLKISKEAEKYADAFLKKDAPISDWIKILDEAIDKVTNPVFFWKKWRYRLLEIGVSPFELSIMEDVFVSNYDKGFDLTSEKLSSKTNKIKIPDEVKSDLLNIISSTIFKSIFPSAIPSDGSF